MKILRIRVVDTPVAIRIENEAVAELLASLWAHVSESGLSSEPAVTVDIPEQVIAGRSEAEAAYAVSCLVTRELIEHHRGGSFLMLHASAVELAGRAVVFVAPSGTGKSTASVYCAQQPGGRYITDETVYIDTDTLLVYPYPKPLSRVVSESPRVKVDLSVAELDMSPSDGPVPLGKIVQLVRDKSDIRLEHPGVSESLGMVAPMTSGLSDMPGGGLAKLASVLDAVGGLTVVHYEEFSDCYERIMAVAQAPREKNWDRVETAPYDSAMLDLSQGNLLASPVQDVLETDDCLVILADNMVYRLDMLTGLVWSLLDPSRAASLPELEKKVVELIGPHPEASALVAQACERLRENELLRG
ncbi:hypothetical protein KRX56_00240 [Dermabacteraceae bacterium TAE3-ERU27]|nr:hypothetical protein [Dermabacteraceae bacterium TAE3-ERU27]